MLIIENKTREMRDAKSRIFSKDIYTIPCILILSYIDLFDTTWKEICRKNFDSIMPFMKGRLEIFLKHMNMNWFIMQFSL